jgi:hypothetical protein
MVEAESVILSVLDRVDHKAEVWWRIVAVLWLKF